MVKISQIVRREDDVDVIYAFAWICNTTLVESSCRGWDGRSGEESHGRNSPGMFRPFHSAGNLAEIRRRFSLLKLLKLLN